MFATTKCHRFGKVSTIVRQRLQIETLESRCLLATCFVTTNQDAAGGGPSGSLRQHIANPNCDLIRFQIPQSLPNWNIIQLVDDIVIDRPQREVTESLETPVTELTILGERHLTASLPITIRGKKGNSALPGDGDRVFDIKHGDVHVAGVVLQSGDPPIPTDPEPLPLQESGSTGRAIRLAPSPYIEEDDTVYLDASLRLSDVIVESNDSTNEQAHPIPSISVLDGHGSGDSMIRIERSEIRGNKFSSGLRFYGGSQGGVQAYTVGDGFTGIEIIDSTIEGNRVTSNSQSSGAGVWITTAYGSPHPDRDLIRISQSTFSGNIHNQVPQPPTTGQSSTGAGILIQWSSGRIVLSDLTITKNIGGGLSVSPISPAPAQSISMTNSIVSENLTSIVANQNNSNPQLRFQDISETHLGSTSTYNLVGIGVTQLVNNVNNNRTGVTNPGLAPLAAGYYVERRIHPLAPTLNVRVHQPLMQSLAYNTGNSARSFDQRGLPRPWQGADDKGAVERRLASDPCDLNDDGSIDAADFGIWASLDQRADVNHDGVVDAADWGIISGKWTGDPFVQRENLRRRVREFVFAEWGDQY